MKQCPVFDGKLCLLLFPRPIKGIVSSAHTCTAIYCMFQDLGNGKVTRDVLFPYCGQYYVFLPKCQELKLKTALENPLPLVLLSQAWVIE